MKTRWFTSAGLLFLAFILPLALTSGRPALPSAAASPDKAASLPALAQGPISALIGADQSVYHARLDGAHFRMDNPEQGLSAEFSADGMQVSAGEHSWGMALEGYGYGESLQPLPVVDPTARDNRIEYARGLLSEWYLNGPFGLEQGFTLATPPAVMTGGPLTLALSQVGDLQAAVGVSGKELVLLAPSGEAVLGYAGLAAYDADGRELKAWLETRAGVNGRPTLLLRLYDHGARYPLTVDPFVQKAKLTASGKGESDHFGSSVAVSGSVVVVGAPDADPGGINYAGAAFVFVKPVGGWKNMTQTAKLTASDKAEGDCFGYSVAISGDVVVVGAFLADFGVKYNAGAAYVFVKPAGGWGNMTQTAKLTASVKQGLDWFGFSVAISDDVVVVGAPYEYGVGASYVAAHVFVKPVGGWVNMTQTAKLTASDKAFNDGFGRSVAISGSVVVVGAQYADPGGTEDAGAAYVFVEPGSGWGNMTQTAKLTASDKAEYVFFGNSVAVSGNVIVVGAQYSDPGGIIDAGAAYVFVKPGGGWTNMTQTAKLTVSEKKGWDYFGTSVAVNDNMVVVGAEYADQGGPAEAGTAYVFVKPGSGWGGNLTETAKLTASDKAYKDHFGYSVSISVNVVVVGAYYADPGGTTDAGAAYVFDGGSLANFRSQGTYDGNILESGESSNVGGTVNATATTFRMGDNGFDRQYRSLLSFDTSTLPDKAVITSVMVKIKKQGLVGTNPFTTHQGLKVDIRKPFFGATLALVASDFQAVAGKPAVGTFGSTPVSGWYSASLNSSGYAYINKTGTTQFRLRFFLDDNDDMGADYVMFYSGDWSTVGERPLLMIQYYVP